MDLFSYVFSLKDQIFLSLNIRPLAPCSARRLKGSLFTWIYDEEDSEAVVLRPAEAPAGQ